MRTTHTAEALYNSQPWYLKKVAAAGNGRYKDCVNLNRKYKVNTLCDFHFMAARKNAAKGASIVLAFPPPRVLRKFFLKIV